MPAIAEGDKGREPGQKGSTAREADRGAGQVPGPGLSPGGKVGACRGWRPVFDNPPEKGRADTGRGGDTPPDRGIEQAEELNKKNFIAIYLGLLLSPGTKNGGSQFSFLGVSVLLF